VVAVAGVAVLGAGAIVAARVMTPHDAVRVSVGPTVDDLRVTGSAHATARVVAEGGATVEVVASADGAGWALQFPGRDAAGGAVAVSVVAPGTGDALSPGTRDFSLGADVRVDPGVDTDGDNVVQRGLSDDVGQYKIELDRGRFACTVKGTQGRVRAQLADERPVPGVWYRMTCDRVGDRIDLEVRRLDDDTVATASATGPIGAVRTAEPGTPLSIGGKLTPSGAVATWQPDQLNGAVGDVWVRIG
jgi:hypothetical protein